MRRYLIDLARARPDAEISRSSKSWNISFPPAAPRLLLRSRWTGFLSSSKGKIPAWCNLVELKFFLGLTDEEAADVLGIKLAHHAANVARSSRWLFERMDPADGKHIAS